MNMTCSCNIPVTVEAFMPNTLAPSTTDVVAAVLLPPSPDATAIVDKPQGGERMKLTRSCTERQLRRCDDGTTGLCQQHSSRAA